jgi:hypothetical protein
LTPIEKLCQLMMALALLVIVSALPAEENEALPAATLGPVGLAIAAGGISAKQAATEAAIAVGRSGLGVRFFEPAAFILFSPSDTRIILCRPAPLPQEQSHVPGRRDAGGRQKP